MVHLDVASIKDILIYHIGHTNQCIFDNAIARHLYFRNQQAQILKLKKNKQITQLRIHFFNKCIQSRILNLIKIRLVYPLLCDKLYKSNFNQIACIKYRELFVSVFELYKELKFFSLLLVMTFACSALSTVGLSLLILAVAWSILSLFQSKKKARLWTQKAGTLCLISGKCLAAV